jgi:mycothiol synthase
LGDPARDFRIAFDSDANALGLGHVWAASPHEVRGFVRVRPSAKRRGVGSALLSWLQRRAREIANEENLPPDAVLTLTNWAKDSDATPLLVRFSLVPVRHFLQMRIDLARVRLREPVWPEGLEQRSISSGADDAELFGSFREAFADHWGNTEVDEAEWWSENRDAPSAGFDPALWFVAANAETIAGLSICREREEDGETIGWVSLLGVRPRWRGRGLGEALLTHSLNVLQDRGRRRAALNVDVDNTTGALRLYTKVGMEPVPAFTVWSKTIANEEPSHL